MDTYGLLTMLLQKDTMQGMPTPQRLHRFVAVHLHEGLGRQAVLKSSHF